MKYKGQTVNIEFVKGYNFAKACQANGTLRKTTDSLDIYSTMSDRADGFRAFIVSNNKNSEGLKPSSIQNFSRLPNRTWIYNPRT